MFLVLFKAEIGAASLAQRPIVWKKLASIVQTHTNEAFYYPNIQDIRLQVSGNLRGDSRSQNKTKIKNKEIAFAALFVSY